MAQLHIRQMLLYSYSNNLTYKTAILFYVGVAYQGAGHPLTGWSDPQLVMYHCVYSKIHVICIGKKDIV